MAQKAAAQVELRNWDEVDVALKKIAECQIALDTIDAEMNMRINDAKAEADKLAIPLRAVVKEQTALVQDYTDGHRTDLEGKSKQLTFGKVGFRQATRISIPTKRISKIIENLRKFGMENCIKVAESVNKDVLAVYPESDIAKVGASVIKEDKFFCEPDKEKVRR